MLAGLIAVRHYGGGVRAVIPIMAGVIVLSLFVPADYIERLESAYTLQEKEGASGAKRLEIIRDSIEVIKRYPEGVGVRAFPKVRFELFGRSQDTHNLYLEAITNLGLVGSISFFYLVYRIWLLARRLSMEAANQFGEGALETNLMCAVQYFIYARLFLGLFGMDMYEIYWWFCLGLCLAVRNSLSRNRVVLPDASGACQR
jgi:O-antigen ligase